MLGESGEPASRLNGSCASFHTPSCRPYTSVTSNGLTTSLPRTTTVRRIVFSTMAVLSTTMRTDSAWMSACL